MGEKSGKLLSFSGDGASVQLHAPQWSHRAIIIILCCDSVLAEVKGTALPQSAAALQHDHSLGKKAECKAARAINN